MIWLGVGWFRLSHFLRLVPFLCMAFTGLGFTQLGGLMNGGGERHDELVFRFSFLDRDALVTVLGFDVRVASRIVS